MSDKKPFFIGYMGVPKGLGGFMLSLTLSLIAFMAFAGIMIGATQDDPGNGAFRFDWRQQSVTGVIEFVPYPILRVTTGNERIPDGHTLMLTGQGKSSISTRMQADDRRLGRDVRDHPETRRIGHDAGGRRTAWAEKG